MSSEDELEKILNIKSDCENTGLNHVQINCDIILPMKVPFYSRTFYVSLNSRELNLRNASDII